MLSPILVQLIASSLGALEASAITSLTSFTYRWTLRDKPISFAKLSLVMALSVPPLDLNLWGPRKSFVIFLVVVMALAQALGALWANPIWRLDKIGTFGTLPISQFPQSGKSFWDNEFQDEKPGGLRSFDSDCTGGRLGNLSPATCPPLYCQGRILSEARSASDVRQLNHSKADAP